MSEHSALLRLAREAVNGWACYAKRDVEHREIARIHSALDDIDRHDAACETELTSHGYTPCRCAVRADFHGHLDVCDQCQREPFNLCSEGARLLSDVHRAPAEETGQEGREACPFNPPCAECRERAATPPAAPQRTITLPDAVSVKMLENEVAALKYRLDACAPYLKDGESPAECIKRNRADIDMLLKQLAEAKGVPPPAAPTRPESAVCVVCGRACVRCVGGQHGGHEAQDTGVRDHGGAGVREGGEGGHRGRDRGAAGFTAATAEGGIPPVEVAEARPVVGEPELRGRPSGMADQGGSTPPASTSMREQAVIETHRNAPIDSRPPAAEPPIEICMDCGDAKPCHCPPAAEGERPDWRDEAVRQIQVLETDVFGQAIHEDVLRTCLPAATPPARLDEIAREAQECDRLAAQADMDGEQWMRSFWEGKAAGIRHALDAAREEGQ